MSNYYFDPTASAAIGAVDKEIARMKKRAQYLARRHRQGRLTPEQLKQEARQFTGIYSRLLKDAFSQETGQ